MRQTERDAERDSNPRRYRARLRAEAYSKRKCPGRRMAPVLESLSESLRQIGGPLSLMAASRHLDFGGDLHRYAVYHLIRIHRHPRLRAFSRHNSPFAPLAQVFLDDFNAARSLSPGLTRKQFIATYSDQILQFLEHYTPQDYRLPHDARMEYLGLRALVALIKPFESKYGTRRFYLASQLETRALEHFKKVCDPNPVDLRASSFQTLKGRGF